MKRPSLTAAALMLAMASESWAQGQQTRHFDSGGVSIGYVDGGDGPAVVLIHGFGGTLAHWQPVKSHLVQSGFRVIAYDVTVAAEKGAILAGRKGPALWLRNDQSRAWWDLILEELPFSRSDFSVLSLSQRDRICLELSG